MYGPVSPLVVVPGHKLNKLVVQSNSSLGIEDARPVTKKRKKLVSPHSYHVKDQITDI
jgi:hypothetical protein